jgi:hypothetical protein
MILDEWPTLTADNVEGAQDSESPSYYLWRNVFASVNLLRSKRCLGANSEAFELISFAVLNKLTKWKHARTMMLVVFKSAPVLKRCMRAKVVWVAVLITDVKSRMGKLREFFNSTC